MPIDIKAFLNTFKMHTYFTARFHIDVDLTGGLQYWTDKSFDSDNSFFGYIRFKNLVNPKERMQ